MSEGWRDFVSAWRDFRVGALEYRELDEERVLVPVRRSMYGKTSGVQLVDEDHAALFHIRDGRVTRVVIYLDPTTCASSLASLRRRIPKRHSSLLVG
jgi:ketosteroid isomerase-like protein